MSNILTLHRDVPCRDITATLRTIADDIEAGKHGLMTTMVLLLGHSGQKLLDDGEIMDTEDHVMFSAGPRDDLFTVRGLLATGMAQIT